MPFSSIPASVQLTVDGNSVLRFFALNQRHFAHGIGRGAEKKESEGGGTIQREGEGMCERGIMGVDVGERVKMGRWGKCG